MKITWMLEIIKQRQNKRARTRAGTEGTARIVY
jgi:hypothetical protein